MAYWNDWVQSKANLADAPSRGDFSLMKRLSATELQLDFSRYARAADSWRITPEAERLVRQG
jgi:hypothetical protein